MQDSAETLLENMARKIGDIFPLELDTQWCRRDTALIVWVRPNMRHNIEEDVQHKVSNACHQVRKWCWRHEDLLDFVVLDNFMMKITPHHLNDSNFNTNHSNFSSNTGSVLEEHFIGDWLRSVPYED